MIRLIYRHLKMLNLSFVIVKMVLLEWLLSSLASIMEKHLEEILMERLSKSCLRNNMQDVRSRSPVDLCFIKINKENCFHFTTIHG